MGPGLQPACRIAPHQLRRALRVLLSYDLLPMMPAARSRSLKFRVSCVPTAPCRQLFPRCPFMATGFFYFLPLFHFGPVITVVSCAAMFSGSICWIPTFVVSLQKKMSQYIRTKTKRERRPGSDCAESTCPPLPLYKDGINRHLSQPRRPPGRVSAQSPWVPVLR